MTYKSVAGASGTAGSAPPASASGGPGGNAKYYYFSNAAGTDRASVYGGAGGGGWSGGGSGGAGGYAKAGVIPTPAVNSANQDYSWARAFGGGGGNAGGDPPSSGGNGGAGGNAYGYATASNTLGTARAGVYARGGGGGSGVGSGAHGGAAGTAQITKVVTATGLSAIVKAAQIGGFGGSGSDGASAMAGADSVLDDIVSGTATGGAGSSLRLTQGAYGGQGGTSGGGTAGAAGYGKSYLTFDDVTTNPTHLAGNLYGTANADGGNGGGYFNGGGTAPDGGAATGSIDLTGAGAVHGYVDVQAGSGGSSGAGPANGGAGAAATVTKAEAATTSTSKGAAVEATATGGAGGEGDGAGETGGAGGLATLPVSSASGFNATVVAIQNAGQGGGGINGAAGGNGADSVLLNQVTGVTTGGTLSLTQIARGGAGGFSYGATAGQGGLGSSSLTFTDQPNTVHAVQLTGNVYAYGGAGGSGFDSSAGANGVEAIAYANLTGTRAVSVRADAQRGGAGGQSGPGLTGAVGGTATAGAYAHSSTSQADKVSALAQAYGGVGGYGYGTGGSGGAGGAAIGAKGAAYTPTGTGNTYASADQAGGLGGVGRGSGAIGGAGGLATGTTAFATGFNLKVSASQAGGGGGAGRGIYIGGVLQSEGPGASGGTGANSKLVNAVAGVSTGGFFYLEQSAVGGGGGSAYANGGAGGYATDQLTFDDTASFILNGQVHVPNPTASNDLVGEVTATGGASGSSGINGHTPFTTAPAGGAAYASQNLKGAHAVDARTTNAYGGAGSSVFSGSVTAGMGGDAAANAVAYSTTTARDRVTAYASVGGGAGGEVDGGSGNGGAGGNVTPTYATAREPTAIGGVAQATVKERGGNGGQVFGSGAAGQTGGAGGRITGASEYAAAQAFGYNAVATARQYGGSGGAGTNGANGGAGASVYLSNGAAGKTTGGYLYVTQAVTGGNGGASTGGTAGAAGVAGSYLHETDTTAATFLGTSDATGGGGGAGGGSSNSGAGANAYAQANITGAKITEAVADATGGDGGGLSGTGIAGAGGTGRANAFADSTGAGNYKASATAVAAGGAGGSVSVGDTGTGGQGGEAAEASAVADPELGQDLAIATETGGQGGIGRGAGNSGGAGGAVSGTIAKAYGGYSGVATAIQTGGTGGAGMSGASGGTGANSTLKNAVSVTGAGGPAGLNETAFGGAGGGSAAGTAGTGGQGYAYLEDVQTGPNLRSLTSDIKGYGGSGGYGTSGSAGGTGGYGQAFSALTSYEDVTSQAIAKGGAGGSSSTPGSQGGNARAYAYAAATGTGTAATASATASALGGAGTTLGNANSVAKAVTQQGELAQATAIADGASEDGAALTGAADTGSAEAITNLNGTLQWVTATTSLPVNAPFDSGNVTLSSSAQTGGITPVAGFGEDYSYADGLPTQGAIDSTLTNTPQYSTINGLLGSVDTTATLLGYGLMGVQSLTTTGTSQTVTTQQTYDASQSQLSGPLELGLLSGSEVGSGFTSLDFTVQVGSTVAVNQAFTSVATANAYFADNAIDLGNYQSSSPAGTTVTVTMTVTSDIEYSGYDVSFLLGSAGVNGPPVFSAAPGTTLVGQGIQTALPGPGFSETGNLTGITFNLTIQDTTGLLSATGVNLAGAGTTELTIIGDTEAQVAAILGTLKVTEPAGSETGDTIVFNATDSLGHNATAYDEPIVVNGAPNINAGPVVVAVNKNDPVQGVSVNEIGTPASDSISVTISDTNGDLSFLNQAAVTADGAVITGANTTSLKITGTYTVVNEALADLYDLDGTIAPDTIALNAKDNTTGTVSGTANLTVSVNGPLTITTPTTRVLVGVATSNDLPGTSLSESGVTGSPVSFTATVTATGGLFLNDLDDEPGSGVTYTENGPLEIQVTGDLTDVNAALANISAYTVSDAGGSVTVQASDNLGNVATPQSFNFSVGDTLTQAEALTAHNFNSLAADGVTVIPISGSGSPLDLTLEQVDAAYTAGISFNYPAGLVVLSDSFETLQADLTPAEIEKLPVVGVEVIYANDGPLLLSAATVTQIEITSHATPLSLDASDGTLALFDAIGTINGLSPTFLSSLAPLGITTISGTGTAGVGQQYILLSVLQAQALASAGLSGYQVPSVQNSLTAIVALYDTPSDIEALQASDYQGGLSQIGFTQVAASGSLALSVSQATALANFTGTLILPTGDGVIIQDTVANITGFLDQGASEVAYVDERLGLSSLTADDGSILLSVAEAEALEGANQQSGLTLTVVAPGNTVFLSDTAADIEAMTPAQIGGLAALGINEVIVTDTGLTLSVADAVAFLDPVPITVPAGDTIVIADTEAEIDSLTPAEITGLAALGVTEIDVANLTGAAPLTIEPGITLAISGAVPSNQTIDFAGASATAGGVLSLTDSPDFAGTVDGLTPLDSIDLTDAAYDPSATASLGAGNVLTVSELSGTYTVQLDPNQVFLTSPTWTAGPDSGTGTVITTSQPVFFGDTQVASGTDADGVVIGSGATVEADLGSAVNRAIIEAGGSLLDDGATITDTVIEAGGTLSLYSIGDAAGAISFGPAPIYQSGNALVGGTLDIESGNDLSATITDFAPGDLIALTGIPYAPDGTAIISGGTLEVTDNGYQINLPLDPAQDFLGQSFTVSADPITGDDVTLVQTVLTTSASIPAGEYADGAVIGNGGVLDVLPGATLVNGLINGGGTVDLQSDGSLGQQISFGSDGGTLEVHGTIIPAATIDGFGGSDVIDLANIAYDPAAGTPIVTNGTVSFTENGVAVSLNFDPQQDFFGSFALSQDAGGTGTDITLNQPAITTPVSNGQNAAGLTIDGAQFTESGALVNVVVEDGGALDVQGGTVSDAVIDAGSLISVNGSDGGSVSFGTPGGTLELFGTQGVSGFTLPSAPITGMAPGDTIDLGNFAYDPTGSATLLPGNMLQITENGSTADLQLDPAQNFEDLFFHLADDAAGTGTLITEDGTPCYCPGTLILTDCGERPVEDLCIGDGLVTRSGAVRPIRWIGRRSYDGRFVADNLAVLPVCIRQGALGDGLPRRDLFVSPLHAMFIDGVLIPARALINGRSIVQLGAAERVEYIHLELDSHDVILAEGAAAESFVDDDSRAMFHNAAEYRALYPQAAKAPALFCAPVVEDGEALEAVRQRLAALLDGPDEAAPGPLHGHLDEVRRDRIDGWACDMAHPGIPARIQILDNGAVIGEVVANRPRADLAQAGYGSGTHGFELAVPGGLSPVMRHVITARRSSDGTALSNSPRVLEADPAAAWTARSNEAPVPVPAETPPPDLRGQLDHVSRERIDGWAWDLASPDRAASLQVLDNGRPIARVLANAYRADLATAGIGTGHHAFALRVPGGLSPLTRHVIEVRRERDGAALPGSPFVIEPAAAFDPALQLAMAGAVDAVETAEDADRMLSFIVAQADRLLARRAAADAGRETRLAHRQFRRRWGARPETGDNPDSGPESRPAAPRVLVIDDAMPASGRDAGSTAILSHMRALRSLGYAVSFVAAEQMAPDPAALAELAAAGVACCAWPHYASVEDVLRRQTGCFDAVYLHRAGNAAAYLALARRCNPRARILYSVADLHHVRLARQAAVENRPELMSRARGHRLAEFTAALSADAVLTHSQDEAALLRRALPQAAVHVVPWEVPVRRVGPAAARQGIAFIGGYRHEPNVDAAYALATSIMPLVWQTDPAIPCLLAGSAMPDAVRRLASGTAGCREIIAVGAVADLGAVFDRVRLTVAPLRYGAGVKGKVLDSLGAGVPCVMSEIAAEGLALPPALRALVGQDPAHLAALICRLHAEPKMAVRAGRAGQAMIRESWGQGAVVQAMRAALGGDPRAPRVVLAGPGDLKLGVVGLPGERLHGGGRRRGVERI